jgi:hypothetical protein
MSDLDTQKLIQKLNELVERPEEYFLIGMLGKRIAWSDYIPLRLVAKRTDYIGGFKIPRSTDHKLSGVASALGALSGMVIGLGFEKGTSGYIVFKNCSLVGGKITDFSSYSVVAIAFPYSKNYVKGTIEAKTKGWRWKNKVLEGIELNLNREEIRRSIENDDALMGLIKEFFGIQLFWLGTAEPKGSQLSEIQLSVKDTGKEKYSIIRFGLLRFHKEAMNFLTERGIDFRRIPELIFDISEKIAQKCLKGEILSH